MELDLAAGPPDAVELAVTDTTPSPASSEGKDTASTSGGQRSAGSRAASLVSNLLSFEGCESYAKVRRQVQLSSRARAVVGADIKIHPVKEGAIPIFELFYDWERDGQLLGTFHLTKQRIALERNFHLQYKAVSARVDTGVALTWQGEPQFGVGVQEIKPWPLVVGAAAVLYLMGRQLSAKKTLGRFLIDVPLARAYTLSKVETRLTVAKGRDPVLKVHQLNPLIQFNTVAAM